MTVPTGHPRTAQGKHEQSPAPNPWAALSALCVGFFMILVDSTIVTVATPDLMKELQAGINSVVWVTSAYLLAYAVPLLITGRLGDRFGPKRLYLTGLTVFTLASLWCGLSGTIHDLIIARVVQGLGAALMTPQTMAVITRIFPANARGRAMGMWGAVAGVATLVGPILGGVLVDGLGWEWIFFVNVPVGLIAFVLAVRLVPRLETHQHSFDWLGVVLSAIGMFALVFGIQEGRTYDWGTISGQITVWRLIIAGLVVLAVFLLWQARNRREPLIPLSLFRDRNFSLANIAMSSVGFAITGMAFPVMIWAQVVRGFSPTQAALLMIPMAVISGGLAPVVGRLSDTMHPRFLAGGGLLAFSQALFWLSRIMTPSTPVWEILLPMALLGVGSGFMWAPISSTATRNLPLHQAGAGSGVYNTVRQVGSVLGSAAIAVLMESRIAAHLPGVANTASFGEGTTTAAIPPAVMEGFSQAMADAVLLPAAALLVGLVAALCFERPAHLLSPEGAPTDR